MPQRLLDAFEFLRFVLRRWTEDRCPQIAGSLTFTTLLALVPMFAVAVALLSTMPFFEDVVVRLKVFLLANLVPEAADRIITVYMVRFAENAGHLTLVGIASLVVVATVMMFAVDRSINTIWRVRRSRPWWISLGGYLLLLSIGPLLLGVSVSVTTYLMTLSTGIAGVSNEGHPFLLRVVPVAVTTTAFFLIYRLVPHRHVPWRHALAGAVIAALLFEAMKEVFAHYLRLVPTYNVVYGAFAAIPVFLVWIYLSWLVILFGAEVTASAAYWRGRLWRSESSPAGRFRDALEVGRRLVDAEGRSVSFEKLRLEAGVPVAELDAVLGQLVDLGVVKRTSRGHYALARTPDEITLGDFYRASVAPGGGMAAQEWSHVAPELVQVADQLEAQLKRPLAEVMARPDAQPESDRDR